MTIARAVALAAALLAGAVGLARGTWAVGGSDSSCYALMAAAFAGGSLQPSTPLAIEAPWPDAPRSFAPGGFVPSPTTAVAASPVCAPGFSLLLAPLYAVGGRDAIFLATPVAGALLVWLTFVLGSRLGGPPAGAAAAVVMAATPVFLFQVMQPMSDVTAAALVTAALVVASGSRRRAATLGALAGLAVLVRPSLAPAAAVFGLWCMIGGPRSLLRFSLGALPFGLIALALNAALYGHPLASGYGEVHGLFALEHVGANIGNYGRALVRTQLGFPLVALAAGVVLPSRLRPVVRLSLAVSAAVVVVYLLYKPFPEWWYLRFLLPALPALTALAAATIAAAGRASWRVLPVAGVLAGFMVSTEAVRDAWRLADLEHRFRTTGVIARDRLPHSAVAITVWDSGSVAYHGGREAVVWDALDPASLDTAIAWLRARGREPYIVVERWEEPAFRARFAATSPLGALDWPPRFDIERHVRIFDPADRERYQAGAPVPTEYVWRDR